MLQITVPVNNEDQKKVESLTSCFSEISSSSNIHVVVQRLGCVITQCPSPLGLLELLLLNLQEIQALLSTMKFA